MWRTNFSVRKRRWLQGCFSVLKSTLAWERPWRPEGCTIAPPPNPQAVHRVVRRWQTPASRGALARFRLVPVAVHLLERALARSPSLVAKSILDVVEARLESPHGSAERLLGVDLHEAPEVREREEEIAELVLDLVLPAAPHRLRKLRELLAHLGEDSLDVRPIESDRRGLLGDALCPDESRKSDRHSADGAPRRLALRLAFVGLDPLPVLHHLARPRDVHVAEDVRVPAGQLLGDAVAHGSEVELPFLAGDAGLEDDLEQQIAELLAMVGGVPRLDGLDDLVRLLEKIGRERPEGLLAVPRASSRIAELVHDVEEPPDGGLRGLLVCHEVPGCTTAAPRNPGRFLGRAVRAPLGWGGDHPPAHAACCARRGAPRVGSGGARAGGPPRGASATGGAVRTGDRAPAGKERGPERALGAPAGLPARPRRATRRGRRAAGGAGQRRTPPREHVWP